MKLTLSQALTILQKPGLDASRHEVFLVCGFEPLHLSTFLKAYLAVRFPGRTTDILTGLYGDLDGTLASAAESSATAAAVIIEWSDLDSRLGLRSTGGWGLSVQQDILENCSDRWGRVLKKLETLALKMPVALVPPTLPIALFGHTPGWQTGVAEADLQLQAASFLASAARIGGVSVLNPKGLARLSPEASRLDARLELAAGFPYSIGHASVLAGEVVKLLAPPSPMKGLITDLDETLWSGVVGEIGARAVSWSLSQHSQIHGLYQQELRNLSEMGVLLAIATKNELAVVDEALRREDLCVPGDAFYPVRAEWSPKSSSIADILRVWNIGPQSVVFVDDSPMEIDEVRTAHPSMACLQFPTGSPAKVLEFLEQVRDLFGRPAVHREDALRPASIRANAQLDEAASRSDGGDFVRGLQGRVIFDARKDRENRRLLELVNKTNQFNLNGVRIGEGEWLRHLEDPASVVVAVSYEDRFGPLGTISVAAGKMNADRLDISTWVLSCRAFSRKIESHTLDYLFRLSGAASIVLAFKATDRNQALQTFLHQINVAVDTVDELVVSRENFLRRNPELPHRVEEIEPAWMTGEALGPCAPTTAKRPRS